MSEQDKPIVEQIRLALHEHGIECYVAERDEQYGKSLPVKVENAIKNSDGLLVLWTKGSSESAFVNQEVGFARAAGRLRIWLVERGVIPKGFDIDKEFLEFNRDDHAQAITKLGQYLTQLKMHKEASAEVARRKRNVIGLVALVGLGFMLLNSLDDSEE